jgi:hypothetical protein
MTQNDSCNGTPEPGDDGAEVVRRVDANPPYEPRPADAVERFRRILADLIAKRILAERRKPPSEGADGGC